jgi:hypothetical protein
VDEVVVTTLVDNVYDALLGGQETITRAPFAAGIAQAPQFESGATQVGLMAEHGFSALVSVRTRSTITSVLFDTGLSPDAMVTNADRLGSTSRRCDRTTDFERGMPPAHLTNNDDCSSHTALKRIAGQNNRPVFGLNSWGVRCKCLASARPTSVAVT